MVAQQQRHIYLVESDLLGRKLTTNLDIINLDYDFLQSCLTIHTTSQATYILLATLISVYCFINAIREVVPFDGSARMPGEDQAIALGDTCCARQRRFPAATADALPPPRFLEDICTCSFHQYDLT